jgi:hypothetical protein
MYEREKLVLKNCLKGKRVCLTIDTWTSIQNVGYMCVTTHLIDSDWKIHKGETIGRKLENALLEWAIDSIFTIIIDNALANKLGIEHIKSRMQDRHSADLGGKFIHIWCVAHILNLTVKDYIDDLSDCVGNIRNAVKYLRSSPARMAKFKGCIKRENIQCTKWCT